MTPEDARHKLYLVSYCLEELAYVSGGGSDPAKLTSTLELLSEIVLDAVTIIHPYVPETTILPMK